MVPRGVPGGPRGSQGVPGGVLAMQKMCQMRDNRVGDDSLSRFCKSLSGPLNRYNPTEIFLFSWNDQNSIKEIDLHFNVICTTKYETIDKKINENILQNAPTLLPDIIN